MVFMFTYIKCIHITHEVILVTKRFGTILIVYKTIH